MTEVIGTIDVAQVVLYLFWIFFAGLIFYLRREDRREGYPLVAEGTGKTDEVIGGLWVPSPKTFNLPHGLGSTQAPRAAETGNGALNARPVARWVGAPLEPTGDPLLAGVGPGAYADRADVPDVSDEGAPRIVPLRAITGFYLEERDPDPRGMTVYGADGKAAGTVSEVWVDRAEILIRYLEVKLAGADARTVLLPMNFSVIDGKRRRVEVDAILGRHFANVPAIKSPDQVTLLEEDKIMAYYGAGKLYALPGRAESLL